MAESLLGVRLQPRLHTPRRRRPTHLRRRLPDNADVGKRPDGVLKRKRSAQLAAPALRVTPIATLMCRYYI